MSGSRPVSPGFAGLMTHLTLLPLMQPTCILLFLQFMSNNFLIIFGLHSIMFQKIFSFSSFIEM